ncbi:MAG: alanine--glyoxylate aminotransferase family protein [Myxococcota bacterium]|nr:alanine--glyoxylate aminotransferase family protein [Myxococcota bacterium]
MVAPNESLNSLRNLPSPRRLLGPGPSNVHADVLQAMARPLVGHLDPAFLEILEGVQAALRALFGSENRFTLPLSATGSAGMETCLANLLEPGDRIVVGVNGVFGGRMVDVATRAGAEVTRVDADWGLPLDEQAMADAIGSVNPKVVAFVHAETSTGVCQAPGPIAQLAREAGALVVLDCVTSLAGIPVELDRWGIDAAYSGTQKCLSCAPGLSPVSFSDRALECVAARSTPVQSWFMDVGLLDGYYGGDRVYHHTAPISAVFGLAEGLARVLDEGMEKREIRHRDAAAYLVESLRPLGFEPLVAEKYRLPMLSTLKLPPSIAERGEARVRKDLLDAHGIEVGAGLGALAGNVWRVGLMGENARRESVDALRSALESELAGKG